MDAHQTESALLNLVINARDAMPAGGAITIRTANLAGAPAGSALPPASYVALEVIDTGSGMSADVLAKAAEPFFTTKPLGTGTGLGLSMVHGFASQSGGALVLASQPGQGTRAMIVFPRWAAPVASEPAAGRTGAEAGQPGGAGHILVVEDEEDLRLFLGELLGAHGYTVTLAETAFAALDLLERGRFSAVLTDVGLPDGMNGSQLAQAVFVRWPALPVLFMTGYVAREDDREDPAFRRSVVLRKPFGADQVLRALRSVLASDAPVRTAD